MNQEIIDIRLVNICNNKCLYCMENSLRKKESLVKLSFDKLSGKSISIYGGNIFFYPNVINILKKIVNKGIKIISIQTNGYGLSIDILKELKKLGISTINFKFHSLDVQKDYLLAGKPKRYISVKKKLFFLRQMINMRFIVRINYFITKLNLSDLYTDFFILYKLGIWNFDYIGSHPFDKVRSFKDLVLIDYENKENKKSFNNFLNKVKFIKLFEKRLNINIKKIPKSFFENNNFMFFDVNSTIYDQISIEDKQLLNGKKKPYCYSNRCRFCFLKDICKFYNNGNKIG